MVQAVGTGTSKNKCGSELEASGTHLEDMRESGGDKPRSSFEYPNDDTVEAEVSSKKSKAKQRIGRGKKR